MYEVFFEERHLIPAGHFHEVSFEELETDPIGQNIYRALQLPNFSCAERRLRDYVDSIAGYQKNEFSVLSIHLRQRIVDEWQQSFDEWNYPISM